MIANKSVEVFNVSKRDEQHLEFFKVLEKETNKKQKEAKKGVSQSTGKDAEVSGGSEPGKQ